MPDSQAVELKDVERLAKAANPAIYNELKQDIVGLAVSYPLEYMRNENLKKKDTYNLGLFILPEKVFT
jgi:hypothetical protein